LMIRNDISSLEDLGDLSQTSLVVPPAFLAGCGAKYRPEMVMTALEHLGFAEVISLVPHEAALKVAPLQAARETTTRPLITPVCPAIINLIELRFPSLIPHLAPFDSPLEAVQASHGFKPTVYLVSCPAQRSALISHEVAEGILPGRETITEYVTPALLRQAVMEELVSKPEFNVPLGPPPDIPEPRAYLDEHSRPALMVTGVHHVMAVLEDLENDLLGDISVIEPWACDGGCFGSPFYHEDFHVAVRRWEMTEMDLELRKGLPHPVPRRLPFTARPGIRLDADMALAIEKLGQMQELLRTLPGKDCGACGAPSCTTFAEDLVLERSVIGDCPFMSEAKRGCDE